MGALAMVANAGMFRANYEADALAAVARGLRAAQEKEEAVRRGDDGVVEDEVKKRAKKEEEKKKKKEKKKKRERDVEEEEEMRNGKMERKKKKKEEGREGGAEEEKSYDAELRAQDKMDREDVVVPDNGANTQLETLKAAVNAARDAEFVVSTSTGNGGGGGGIGNVEDGDDAEHAAARVALRCAVLLRKSIRAALHMFVSSGATRAARERAAALLASPFAPLDASVTAEGSYADMELFRLVRAVVDMASEETALAVHDAQEQAQQTQGMPPPRRPHERSFKEIYLALYTSAFRHALPGEDDDEIAGNGEKEADEGGREYERSGNGGTDVSAAASAAASAGGGGKKRKGQQAPSTRLRCAPEELMRCLQTDMDIFDEVEKALLTASVCE